MTKIGQSARSIARAAVTLAAAAAVYEALARSGYFAPALLPTIPTIARALYASLAADGSMIQHAVFTLYRVLFGFGLAVTVGIPLGILMARFQRVENFFLPLVSALMPIPSFALVPLAPMNFQITRAGNSVTMTWIPPAGFQNRIPFNDRFSPAYPYEIKKYALYRATAPAAADWEFIGETSSSTLSWTDIIGASDVYYYHARSVNQAGESIPSYGRGSTPGGLYFLAPDNQSMLEVPAEAGGSFYSASGDPMDSYTIEISSHAEDLGGRVMKSVEFSAFRGGIQADSAFKLAKSGTLKLFYAKAGGTITPSVATDGKALSMFYNNGSRWLQLFGKVNEAERSVQLETSLLGRYQLRTTERSGSFAADKAGLLNRLITPNGDGKNDTMVFIFDNPQDKQVKGRIYDLRGAQVAAMKTGPVSNSLAWDAKAGGQTVPGGVYIYQLEADGTVYNGTVVVIK